MTALSDRYGAPSPVRRRMMVAVAAAVAVGFLGWLAWATWFHATPQVESQLVAWGVTGDHEAVASVSVTTLEDDVSASCVVRAVAADHTTVGEVAFEPTLGRNEVTIRTERRATSVSLLGCTTEGQPRPR